MPTLADLNNTEAAVQAGKQHLEEADQPDGDGVISRAEALATKRRLEGRHEADRETGIVMVPIGEGDDEIVVPMYPIEPGKVLEISRMQIEGDVAEQIVAEDEKRRLMAEKNYHPDVFDREFFNVFDKDEIASAWNEWAARSRNIEEPLGNR
ncbi:hypothetical protein [Natrarchaeobaculum sulfurireducens]|uniref:Uncharacterized protein n=1 Tax=Natrarchaeobaculum sulfurireducens TaxID=2044521 RepID=A0A346PMP0_9EURY|nr:hypothetical protein [Natrarchaeobaculum sulfurireducens]AXR80785.1 hypothetical protein AArcMg_0763 [Natrarchaeobaculum sulfurireducens]